MKKQEVIFALIDTLETALSGGVTVRTRGGDGSAAPPAVILDWSTSRLDENGHKPLAGYVRDGNDNVTGLEFHRYYEMTADFTVRADTEAERDSLLEQVGDAFLPYEYDSDPFDPDTTEWTVGDDSPRSVPVVEPDWYEGGIVVYFKFVTETTQSADSLDSVTENVHADL